MDTPEQIAERIVCQCIDEVSPTVSPNVAVWLGDRIAKALTAERQRAEAAERDALSLNAQLQTCGQMRGAADDKAEAMERERDELTAHIAVLREALSAIRLYGSDTLSGRVNGPDDREWQRDAVLEMTRRARVAIQTTTAASLDALTQRVRAETMEENGWFDWPGGSVQHGYLYLARMIKHGKPILVAVEAADEEVSFYLHEKDQYLNIDPVSLKWTGEKF